jgi:hypothetical protein
VVYPTTHVLLRAYGFFGTSTTTALEKWTIGWRIGGTPDLISEATKQAFADAVRPLYKTYHQTGGVNTGTNCYFQGITCAQIGVDGKYTGAGAQLTTYSVEATPAAGLSTPSQAYSAAWVVTMRGARKRGYASYGRYYMPGVGLLVASDGMLSASNQSSAIAAAKTFLDGVNAQAASKFVAGSRVAIFSKVGAGAWQAVTEIGMDRRLDAQERREKSLTPSYSYSALA